MSYFSQVIYAAVTGGKNFCIRNAGGQWFENGKQRPDGQTEFEDHKHEEDGRVDDLSVGEYSTATIYFVTHCNSRQ
jgi:hypothetical protein